MEKYILIQYMTNNRGNKKPDFYYGCHNKKYSDIIEITIRSATFIFDDKERVNRVVDSLNKGGYKFVVEKQMNNLGESVGGIRVNYKLIQDAIIEYKNMTSLEIQNQVMPIIKSYNVNFLSEKIGVSKEVLYKCCKKGFVIKDWKLNFEIYIKIMAMGINENPIGETRGRPAGRTLTEEKKKRKEEREKLRDESKERRKEYQHRYYIEVTKKKRAEKRK